MTATMQWLLSRTGPSCRMTAQTRMRLFRNSRLAVAAIMLGAFPLMSVISSETPAVIVALLLLGVLPAVTALDMRRAALLDRAVLISLVITGAVLTAGVLRGLSGIAALTVIGLAIVEAFIVGRRSIRKPFISIALVACAMISMAMLHAQAALKVSGENLWSTALIVVCMAVSTSMIACAMMEALSSERAARKQQQIEHFDHACVASETIVTLDSSGAVLRASANAERILGLSTQALMGRGLAELVLVADRPAFLTALSDAAHAEAFHATPYRKLRFRMRSSALAGSPSYRWVEAIVSQSATAPGRAIAALRDISKLVMEEQMLAAAADEAEAAKSARSAFLATINHELRTPLNAIIGFSDILANPKTMPTDAMRMQEYAGLINGAGRDLLRMVCMMIDITRLDSDVYEFDAEIQDLNTLVETSVEAFSQEPEARDSTFSVSLPKEMIEAEVDARAINHVLQQLLSNAIKFGGAKNAVKITLKAGAGHTSITVSDRGQGIPKDKLALLGRHFIKLDERMSRDQGGIGLGLSLARGLMALHAGSISIESHMGKGTTVTLSLPHPGTAQSGITMAAANNIHQLNAPVQSPELLTARMQTLRDRRIA